MLAFQNIKPETIRSPIIQQIVDVIVCDSRTIIFVFGVRFATILWGTSKMISLKKNADYAILNVRERASDPFGSSVRGVEFRGCVEYYFTIRYRVRWHDSIPGLNAVY